MPNTAQRVGGAVLGRIGAALRALIRTRLTAGVITILPLLVTLWLVRAVFFWMRDASVWVFELYLTNTKWGEDLLVRWGVAETVEKVDAFEQQFGFRPAEFDLLTILPVEYQWGLSIVSVLLTVLLLYMIGLFAANFFGRRIIQLFERFLEAVPIVKTIYRGLKQVLETLTSSQSRNFQRAALIPFPQERMRCVGFITAIFKDSVTNEELATVFIPTTPNPTTGYLQVVRRAELVELDWSVEDAVRTIMSGGILRPDFLTIVPNAKRDQPPSEAMPPLESEPGPALGGHPPAFAFDPDDPAADRRRAPRKKPDHETE